MAPSADVTVPRPGAAPKHLRAAALGLALAGLAACEHAQPFGAAPAEPNQPFSTAFPRQLTFSAGPDLQPAWLPDGSGIIYSYALLRADNDRCLGILPAEGGHLLRTICHVPLEFDAESTNVLSFPAVGPGGLLAYVREGSALNAVSPSSRELVVATLDDPDPGRVVLTLPYTAPDGQLHKTLSHLHWLGARSLVYLAEQVSYPSAPATPDTVLTPIEVARLTLVGDSGVVSVVPGTAGATSVSPSPTDSGTVYITMTGDSAVYAVSLATGQKTVAFTLSGAGPASDAQVAGSHLTVIAAGLTRQTGLAGQLYDVNLVADSVGQLTARMDLWYQRPALSPSGARVVAEGHTVIYYRPTGVFGPVDTLVSTTADLWLLPMP